MLFTFLTVVHAIIALALVTVVLMQRSEGGGLGMGGGGSPAGLMSARGAADFLTRATAILATIFVALSILLAALGIGQTSGREIDTSLDRTITPEQGAGGSAADLLGTPAAPPAQSAANPLAPQSTQQQAPATPASGTPAN